MFLTGRVQWCLSELGEMAAIQVSLEVEDADCDLLKVFPDAEQGIRGYIQLVLDVLYESESEYPPVTHIVVALQPFDGVAATFGTATHKRLRLSSEYFTETKHGDNLRFEVTGVLVHELTHALQFDGFGTANSGFVEGLADWVRFTLGLQPRHWPKYEDGPREGARWDAGYETTAYFLHFIEASHPHISKRLNLLLRDLEWEETLFDVLTMKSVNTLWAEYLSAFSQNDEPSSRKAPRDSEGYPVPWIRLSNRVPKDATDPFTQVFATHGEAIASFASSSRMVLQTLYSHDPSKAPEHVSTIHLILCEMEGVAHCTSNQEISLSVGYLRGVLGRNNGNLMDLRAEIEGVFSHELTHVWQQTCSNLPSGFLEGIADYVRLSHERAPPHWKGRTDKGDKWDTGYDKTAYFLEWMDELVSEERGWEKGDLVRKMNAAIGTLKMGWNATAVFDALAGRSVQTLWKKYVDEGVDSSLDQERVQKDNEELVDALKRLLDLSVGQRDALFLKKLNDRVGASVRGYLRELDALIQEGKLDSGVAKGYTLEK
ncbi:peptidase of plants and bacteria-domain-containing protein [Chytriomyces sp. MP71]|nr:peptidase of plants and bacteria-domain-containing protein [Chytriomyces sp. MP71]